MFRRTLAAVLLFGLLTAVLLPSAAQPPKALDAAPANAALVVSLNVKKVWNDPALGAVKEARGRVEFGWLVNGLIGFTPEQLDRVTLFWTGGKELAGPFVLAETREDHDVAKVLGMLPRSGKDESVKPLGDGVLSAPGAEFPLALKLSERALLLAPKLDDPKALAKLAGQLRRDATGPAVVVRASGEGLTLLVGQIGNGRDPLQATTSAVFALDPTKDGKAKAELTLGYASKERAAAASHEVESLLADLGKWSVAQQKLVAEKPFEHGTPGPLLEVIAATLKGVKVRADGLGVVAATELDLGEVVRGLVTAVPDAAFSGKGTNSPAENNLKQIGLAIHNYHDTHGKCPGNSYSKDGKPLLSCGVHILPFIEQNNLYQQFKLDEPWDSDHNVKLSKVIVRTYTIPGRPAPLGETYFRTFIGPKNVKGEYRPWLLEGSNDGPKLTQVTDGTSNTLMAVEAGEAVVWTKPDDLVYDGVLPVPQLGGPSGRFMTLMGDGSVRTFRRAQLSDTTLRGMITVSGGEVFSIP